MENFSEVYRFHGLYGFHGLIDLLVSGFHELIALLGFGFVAESSGPFRQTVSALFFLAKKQTDITQIRIQNQLFFYFGPQNFSLFRTPRTIADSE